MDTRFRRATSSVSLSIILAALLSISCTGGRKAQESTSEPSLSADTCCGPLRQALEQMAQTSTGEQEAPDDRLGTYVVSLVNELELGDHDAHAIASQYEVSDSADLSAIVQRLARFSDRPVLNYEVKVIEGTAQMNAFSIAGGHLYITKSLLEQMQPTEGELAFILAHEMAHAALRHLPSMMERWWWSNTLIKIQLCQAASQGRIAGNAVCPAFEALGIAEHNTNLEAEFAADQFGALYLVQAGYKLSDAESALKKLIRIMGDVNQFGTAQDLASNSITSFPTHPPVSSRIDQLSRFRNQLLQVASSVERAIEHLGRQDYDSAAQAFSRVLQLFPESRSIRLNLALTHHLMYRSSLDEQGLGRGTLSSPQALEVKWTNLLTRGAPSLSSVTALERAVKGYKSTLASDPHYYPARNNLAVAYLDSGNIDGAIIELERALASNRRFAPSYRNLSLAFLEKLDAAADVLSGEPAAWALQAQSAWLEYKTLQPVGSEADAAIEERIADLEKVDITSAKRRR